MRPARRGAAGLRQRAASCCLRLPAPPLLLRPSPPFAHPTMPPLCADARAVYLTIQSNTGSRLSLAMPPNNNVVPPGM